MNLPPRNFLHLAAGAAALSTLVPVAWAQDWQTRPVTMVVPFAAGGPLDTGGRLVAPVLSERLGQQVIVENVVGAGGMTGAARVAKAAPDGYQFVLGNSATHAQNQSLYKRPMYNPVTDFSPVTAIYHSTPLPISPPLTSRVSRTSTPAFGRRFFFRRGHPRRLFSGSRARPAMPWTRRLCANASRTSDCASLGRRKGCPNILPRLSRLRSRNGRGQSRRAA